MKRLFFIMIVAVFALISMNMGIQAADEKSTDERLELIEERLETIEKNQKQINESLENLQLKLKEINEIQQSFHNTDLAQ